jgi:hypothetical protein
MSQIVKLIDSLISFVKEERDAKRLTERLRGIKQQAVAEDIEENFNKYALERLLRAYNTRKFNYTRSPVSLRIDVKTSNEGMKYEFHDISCELVSKMQNKNNVVILRCFSQVSLQSGVIVQKAIDTLCKEILEAVAFHGIEYYHLRNRSVHLHPHQFYTDFYPADRSTFKQEEHEHRTSLAFG